MDTAWYDFSSRLNQIDKNVRYCHETNRGRQRGREAEENLAVELGNRIAGTGWSLFTNVRVPDTVTGKGSELDFVLVGPEEAFVLDLKHWSGHIDLEPDGTIFQTSQYGEPKACDPQFMPGLLDDAELLIQYNALQGHGAAKVTSFVVFDETSSGTILAPALAEHKNVLTREQLREFLPPEAKHMSWAARLLWAIIGFVTSLRPNTEPDPRRTKQPTDAMRNLRKTLRRLPTWDTVRMNGDLVYRCDILTDFGHLRDGSVHPLNRKEILSCDIQVDESKIKAFFSDPSDFASVRAQPVKNKHGEVETYSVPLNLSITIHTPDNKKIPLGIRNIRHIEFGYRESPTKQHAVETLAVGDVIAGKVQHWSENGVRLDVGTSRGARKTISAFARMRGAYPEIGKRVLVRIRKILEGNHLDVEVIPIPAHP